jgi:hypothetical protein
MGESGSFSTASPLLSGRSMVERLDAMGVPAFPRRGNVVFASGDAEVGRHAFFDAQQRMLASPTGMHMKSSGLLSPSEFAQLWMVANPQEIFAMCRRMRKNRFVSSVLYMKQITFAEGFRFLGAAGRKLEADYPEVDFSLIADDLWQEFLLCDNAVVVWRDPQEGGRLPELRVLDCDEIQKYESAASGDRIWVKAWPELLEWIKASEEGRSVGGGSGAGLVDVNGKELTSAMVNKGGVPLHLLDGWHFRLLTTAKRGCGLAVPRLFSIFLDLAIEEVHQSGDFNGALKNRDAPRHYRMGHKIDKGRDEGAPKYYGNEEEFRLMAREFEKKIGVWSLVGRFDGELSFPFMDPVFFTDKKYEGLRSRLTEWAGPVMQFLRPQTGEVSQGAMTMLRQEGKWNRQRVAGFLQRVLGAFEFSGALIAGVRVGWNPWAFFSQRYQIEYMRFLQDHAHVSNGYFQDLLEVDAELEDERSLMERSNPDRWIPIHEPAQGGGLSSRGEPGTGVPPQE